MAQRRTIQQPSHQKDTIGAFLNPENGYRGHLVKQGITPKNHMKENLREIRATQQKLREKREEDEREVKPLYKLPQFQNVAPKLYDEKENSAQRRASFDSNREFLTRGQSEARRDELARAKKSIRKQLEDKLEEERLANEKPNTPRKAPVPRSYETAELAPPSNKNFIQHNRIEAVANIPQRRSSVDSREPARHEEFGRVPHYLEERKAQWAEEEEEMRRRRPDPDCPPGMRLMPESERLQTLEV